jgi:hypothetical protein
MRYFPIKLLAGMLLLSGTALAQAKLSLEPRVGYGTFQMKSMKDYQQVLIKQSEVNAQATDTFGPYAIFGASALYALGERTSAGLFIEQSYTGGRVDYEDYSGRMRYDFLLRYRALGLVASTKIPLRGSSVHFVQGAELSLIYTRMKLKEDGQVYERVYGGEETYKANGFGVQPFVGLEQSILSLPTRLTVGYQFSGSSTYFAPNNKGTYPANLQAKDLKPDWSGLRVNLSVAVSILKQKH